jgi:hypothetical protein
VLHGDELAHQSLLDGIGIAACCLAGTASFFLFGRGLRATKGQSVERNNIFVRLLEKISWLLMVVGYLIYPTANTVLFQTFNCQSIDSIMYLRNDLSINCADSAHQTVTAFALLLAATFSVGLPITYLALLVPHRSGFAALSGRAVTAMNSVHQLQYYYW